ncbi:zinc-binding dehydrogenase [Sneathiella chungangensis]|uniref:Zinc-binding dehydrogenase n=1 Tax=Sneathiella chungangensis TaxID=1418234 RepID=A0A845MDN2_9PROT|nr:NADP-dependent oxidoreductase [Sneathiella chungangensis]MZR22153.1 zinc-binding dehydrogenase [Sneathiella chungangensis]
MSLTNKQYRLAARPVGVPKDSDWEFTTEPVPEIGAGDVLVKNHYASLDPAMRGWMNEGRSYIPPVKIGAVMRAGTVGEVIASNSPDIKVGEFVSGMLGIQQYGKAAAKELTKVDPNLAPIENYLGGLGMPGLTAYFGLLDVGAVKEGDTVLVSGAAGAVGSIVGQIAKIKGARAVGIAGGAEKCAYVVDELGFDACLDYKSDSFKQDLKEPLKTGVDVYFDNVGGEILDIALARINRHARIVICGAISQYNNTTPMRGPQNYINLLVHHARMEGFVVFDYVTRYGEGVQDLATWYREGKLKLRNQIETGIGNFPSVLLKLFKGENTGKLLLKVVED